MGLATTRLNDLTADDTSAISHNENHHFGFIVDMKPQGLDKGVDLPGQRRSPCCFDQTFY